MATFKSCKNLQDFEEFLIEFCKILQIFKRFNAEKCYIWCKHSRRLCINIRGCWHFFRAGLDGDLLGRALPGVAREPLGPLTLSGARSRLHQRRFSLPNMHVSAFFKIYKRIIFSQTTFSQNLQIFNFFNQIKDILQKVLKVAKICKILKNFW